MLERPKPKTRRLYKVLGVFNACFMALGLFIWNFGTKALARKPMVVHAVPAELVLTNFTVRNERDDLISGWYKDGTEACGVVILAHGRGSSKTSMVKRAKLFSDAGMAVVLFDFRGHGESGGDRIEFGFSESGDIEAVTGFVVEQFHGKKLAGVGSSLGAAAITFADIKPTALVFEEMYATLFETSVYRTPFPYLRSLQASLLLAQVPLRLGYSAADVNPAQAVTKISAPALVLAGTDDQYVDKGQTERIFTGLKGPKELIWFNGARHQDLRKFDPELYAEKVVPFLKGHLCE